MRHFGNMLNLLNKLIPYYNVNLLSSIPGKDFLQYELRVYVQSGTSIVNTTSAGSLIVYNGSLPTTYWFKK